MLPTILEPPRIEFPQDLFDLWCESDERTLEALVRESRSAQLDDSTEPRPRSLLQLAGVALSRIGFNRRAIPLLKHAVASELAVPGPLNDLGTVQLLDGCLLHAWETFESARVLRPNEVWTLENLARAEIMLGRVNEAIARLESCITSSTMRPSTWSLLGTAWFSHGEPSKAKAFYLEALALDPDCGDAQIGLGQLEESAGSFLGAEQHYRSALANGRSITKARFLLGQLYMRAGHPDRALQQFLATLSYAPAHSPTFQILGVLLKDWPEAPSTSELLRAILDACRSGEVDVQEFMHAGLRLLHRQNDILEILNRVGSDRADAAGGLGEIGLAGELFLELLRKGLITDSVVEQQLTLLRERFLDRIYSGQNPSVDLPLAAALAQQCFYNGFVYTCSSEEDRRVDLLEDRIKQKLARTSLPCGDLELELLALAMYGGLNGSPLATSLERQSGWSACFQDVLRTQVVQPCLEQAICVDLRRWTVTRPLSEALPTGIVRTQYESHPYPTWSTLTRTCPQPASRYLRRLFPHFSPPQFLNHPCRLLVAGCGTGQHALGSARRLLTSELTAVDISLNSLAYAERMRRELNIEDVTFLHGDILDLPIGALPFDVIECAGVLHHLEDPEVGWRRLCDLLRPGGVMKVAVYSSRAREGILAAKRFVEEKGYGPTPDGIRIARQALLALEPGRLARAATALGDFYSASGCIDMLFHVQEQNFDLERIDRCLQDTSCRFIGFDAIPTKVRMAYRALFPSDPEETSLYFWQAFEDIYPLTFLRMYQFWCQKIE